MKFQTRVVASSRKGGVVIKEEGGNLYAYAGGDRIGKFVVAERFSWRRLRKFGLITCGDVNVQGGKREEGVGTALVVLGLLLCSRRFSEVVVRVDDLMLRNFLRGFGAVDAWGFFERMAPFAKEAKYLKFILDRSLTEALEKRRKELGNEWSFHEDIGIH